MTKKNYIRIARAIADALQRENANPRATLNVLASRVADELALDNPRFDRPRFMRACGLITPLDQRHPISD